MEKDHLEILLEDMNGKFDLMLEGHTGLRHEISRLREELGEKIDLNTIRIEALDEKLSARIDAVDEKLSARIDSVEENLGVRIDLVETRIDSVEENLGARIDAVGADLTAHRRDTEVHGGYQVSESLPGDDH
jgi:chromosome segregation ATPase